MKCFLCLLTLLSVGCAGRFEEARLVAPVKASASITADRARCLQLDDRKIVWSAIAKGATIAGGAAGLGTIPLDDKDARIGLAIGGASLAVVGGVAGFVSEAAASSWVSEGCGQ